MKTLELNCLSVSCGDSIILRFLGNDSIYHNILMDGGYIKTYRRVLQPEIEKIIDREEKIDLLIGTHYDGDHIGGLVSLVNDRHIDLAATVKTWWLNCDLPIKDPDGAITSAQLVGLKEALRMQGKLPQTPIFSGSPPLNLYGASLSILSPDVAQYNEARLILERKSTEIERKKPDYHHRIEHFRTAVNEEIIEDDKIANGSSIAILCSISTRKLLLLGDSFPSVICRSLRDLGYSELNPLQLECIKLSHHASKKSTSNELLSLLRTNKFIVSANAVNTHNLPHKATLARILINGARNADEYFDFYFTHDNKTIRSIFEVDGPDVYEKWRFNLHFPQEGQTSISVL